jgi:hypothetical protein
MVRLNAHPEKYDGLNVENCGLLFLGTPHSGTTLADWNDFLSGLAAVAGLRTDVIDNLRSFNGFGVESKEAFGSIPRRPPYYCLCETKLIKIGGQPALVSLKFPRYKSPNYPQSISCHTICSPILQVVTKDSAGLNEAVAFPMPGVDHREMCKYGSKFDDAYFLIVERLG